MTQKYESAMALGNLCSCNGTTNCIVAMAKLSILQATQKMSWCYGAQCEISNSTEIIMFEYSH